MNANPSKQSTRKIIDYLIRTEVTIVVPPVVASRSSCRIRLVPLVGDTPPKPWTHSQSTQTLPLRCWAIKLYIDATDFLIGSTRRGRAGRVRVRALIFRLISAKLLCYMLRRDNERFWMRANMYTVLVPTYQLRVCFAIHVRPPSYTYSPQLSQVTPDLNIELGSVGGVTRDCDDEPCPLVVRGPTSIASACSRSYISLCYIACLERNCPLVYIVTRVAARLSAPLDIP